MEFLKGLFSGGSKGVGSIRAIGMGVLALIIEGDILPFADNINLLIVGILAAIVGFLRSSTSDDPPNT